MGNEWDGWEGGLGFLFFLFFLRKKLVAVRFNIFELLNRLFSSLLIGQPLFFLSFPQNKHRTRNPKPLRELESGI